MARSSAFRSFARLMMTAMLAHQRRCSISDAMGALQDMPAPMPPHPLSRRQFLIRSTAAGTMLALGSMAGFPLRNAEAAPRPASLSVGIVGGGLAGLACADALKAKGIQSSLYDGATRAGGRCWSLRSHFPGQVAERGGELIDNLHKTMLGYANRFGLPLEDVNKQPGEIFYHFSGFRYAEASIVAEFRDFVSVMRADLNRLSPEVTAAAHTLDDVSLDRTNLLAYLNGQNGAGIPAGPLATAAIVAAFEAEYGLAASEQSCLNFLLFIHADRRSKFTPFGVFSDERYHLVGGNDGIIDGLTRDLSGQITYGCTLTRVRRLSDGRIELTCRQGSRTVTYTHDVAVLAIPFTTLRDVELDQNLGIPPPQLAAIHGLGYGTNAKMMLGFSARPWRELGGNGTAYSNLPNLQTTWETNPNLGSTSRGILTDYSSGARGAGLDPKHVQREASRVLYDLDLVYPGALGAAAHVNGQYLVHLEHWPSNPMVKGSYTCYKPGQFTTMAGWEGATVGNLLFAGEHANSFYEWQGFMEGAALSGLAAARAIAAMVKSR